MKVIISFILVLISCNLVFASETDKSNVYKMPSFAKTIHSQNNAQDSNASKDDHAPKFVKSWDDNSHYKLKDHPEKERAVASNPDDEKVKPKDINKTRNPSSIQNNIKVKGWDILPTLDY